MGGMSGGGSSGGDWTEARNSCVKGAMGWISINVGGGSVIWAAGWHGGRRHMTMS